ncbi:hypothetical protein CYMTET_46680 [Cymbomonas tetramitiformis]|uniref:beta-galactoside alpha-(2,6)-sialyltransferase n=1 Tax=Cymbomonas tetramitiformis TaxID=36881 RepID=A0AAE0EXD1_9CHLO|nr:hypothetical protein CYMTET_46680 [Cymbomonas tetramitiformis]
MVTLRNLAFMLFLYSMSVLVHGEPVSKHRDGTSFPRSMIRDGSTLGGSGGEQIDTSRRSRSLLQAEKVWRPCGGAPDELIPFDITVSPWSDAPEFDPTTFNNTDSVDSGKEDLPDNAEADATNSWLQNTLSSLAAGGGGARRTLERAGPGAGARHLQGYTLQTVGCSRRPSKVMHEHDGPGPKVGRRIQKGEEPLVQCLRGIGACSKLAYEAATRIMSIRRMTALHYATASLLQGKRRFATCAVVGNAGHTLNHKLGKFIDKHEAIIRFNVMATDGYNEHVGKRTTHRMLNHGRSITGCCRSKLPENTTHHEPITVLLWHPGGQDEIASECRTRYPANVVLGLQRPVIGRMVTIMKALRMDMARLGFGPMSRKMTSFRGCAIQLAESQTNPVIGN